MSCVQLPIDECASCVIDRYSLCCVGPHPQLDVGTDEKTLLMNRSEDSMLVVRLVFFRLVIVVGIASLHLRSRVSGCGAVRGLCAVTPT